MPVPTERLFADTRTVQRSNGSLSIVIPSELVERYGIEAGAEVLWYDSAESDEPRFIPPSKNEATD